LESPSLVETAAVVETLAAVVETLAAVVETLAAAVEFPLQEAREELVVQVLQVLQHGPICLVRRLELVAQALLRLPTHLVHHVQHHQLHQAARHLDQLHQVPHLVEAVQVLRVNKI
jgi:hypothetical protein